MENPENITDEQRAEIIGTAITGCYQARGLDLADMTIEIWTAALRSYPLTDVRRELFDAVARDRFFDLPTVIARLDALDGRPTASAMWIEVNQGEDSTIWQTAEAVASMPQSRRIALSSAIAENDRQQIAQIREAFKTDYDAAVAAARKTAVPVRWIESPGFDADHRAQRMAEAIVAGRITSERAQILLPHMPEISPVAQQLGSELHGRMALTGAVE